MRGADRSRCQEFQEGKPARQTGRLGRNFSSECVGCPPTLSGQTAGMRGQEGRGGGSGGLTQANCAGDVGGVAGFAGAAEGPQRVDALAVPAQVSHHATLVNVWREGRGSWLKQINGPGGENPRLPKDHYWITAGTLSSGKNDFSSISTSAWRRFDGRGLNADDTSAVGGEPGTKRAHLLILCGPREGAELTAGAPSSAAITAALSLGHHVPVAGGHLTQRGQNFSEAEAFAVI